MAATMSTTQRQELDRNGFLKWDGMIATQKIQAIRAQLESLLRSTPQQHAGTAIIGGLIEYEVFDPTWRDPRILESIGHVLQCDPLLLGVYSRGIRPGAGMQALHTDWGGQGQPGVSYLCHAICAVVEFTSNNGATRVVPGSHRMGSKPSSFRSKEYRHPDEVQLLGKAGTVFILNVHCLHSAMQNESALMRWAIFSSFTRRDSPILQQTGFKNPDAKVLERFDEATKRLLTL